MSLLPAPPLVYLLPHHGGPPKARVERVTAYMKRRRQREARRVDAIAVSARQERERVVACTLCGAMVDFRERCGAPDALVICRRHRRSMPAPYPLREVFIFDAMPRDVAPMFETARLALWAFNKLINERERQHGQDTTG